jgi:two-component system sensor histidine kinase KdpD
VNIRRAPHAVRIAVCAAAIAAVTGVVYGLDGVAPTVSLVPLYLFAVVPVAAAWGLPYGVATSIASMLTFNFLFLPPLYTFTLTDSQNWVALTVYVVVAIVVAELAARARRRAAEAEQREREEALLAEAATAFLQGRGVATELAALSGRVADVLKAQSARIELGPQRDPPAGESPHELRAGGRRIGTLYLHEGSEPNLTIRRRFLPALASLLAVADERERLARDAVEAEALRRSDAIKTAVLRAVSHDLQSPLTAIIAAAGTLRSPGLELDASEHDGLLETIALEAGRLERFVRDLLDLSRLEAGAAAPLPEVWTVDDLVAQGLDELSVGSERVRTSIPADVPPVWADATQLRRALANLFENALKFSPEDILVRVNATRKDVVIRVVDQGPGMAEGELERVFEPFYRSETEPGVRGSGLGLAISKGFVEANDGRIWAESRPGQGSSFAVTLPVAPMPVPVES